MAVKPLALRITRVFTVVFALSVLTWLVVDAQQRADSRAEAGATSPVQQTPATVDREAAIAGEAPTAQPLDGAAPEDDPLVFEAPRDAEGFLYSSKVAPIMLDASGKPIEVTPIPEDQPQHVFIGSSKSLPIRIELPEVDVEEGTFLPTSKSGRVILPVTEPAQEPESVD